MIGQAKIKLNILICAYCVDKDDVGEARMSYDWIIKLAESVNVHVLTTGSRYTRLCGLEDQPDIKLIKLNLRMNFKWWESFDRAVHPAYIEFFFKARQAARKLIAKENIDLCHHLAPYSLRYPSPLSGLGAKFIVGPIGGGLKPPAVMKQLNGKEGLLFKLRALDNIRMRFDPLLVKHYAQSERIILSAPYMKSLISQRYHDKCEVISGIAVQGSNIKQSSSDNHYFRINYVGRVVASKGLELLILALAQLRKRNIILTIYGQGPQEDQYRNLAEKLGIADRIIWKGFLPNIEVTKALADANIFAFPSLKEPAGIAVIEAMAAGLPVVCVDSGGPGYIVTEDCGIKVRLSDKEQMVAGLTRAIAKMMDLPKKTMQMGRNARSRAMLEFSWDSVAKKMLGVYKQVAQSN